jgi:hypothetical protein
MRIEKYLKKISGLSLGWVRLFIVLSVVWVCITGFFNFGEIKDDFVSTTKTCLANNEPEGKEIPTPDGHTLRLLSCKEVWSFFVETTSGDIAIILLPPLFLLLILTSFRWVYLGFKEK